MTAVCQTEYCGWPVNQDNSKDGGANIDGTNNGCVQKSRVGTVSKDIKELSGVEHDGVDTGELLEEGDEDSTSLQHRRETSVVCKYLTWRMLPQ